MSLTYDRKRRDLHAGDAMHRVSTIMPRLIHSTQSILNQKSPATNVTELDKEFTYALITYLLIRQCAALVQLQDAPFR